MKDAIRAAGKHCGVVATGDDNVQKRSRRSSGPSRSAWIPDAVAVRMHNRWRTVGARSRDERRLASGGFTPAVRGSTDGRVNPARSPDVSRRAQPPISTMAKANSEYATSASLFEGTHVEVESFARHLPEIASYQLAGPHGVIVLSPKVTATRPR